MESLACSTVMGHRFRVYTLNRRMGAVDPQLFSWGRGGCFYPFPDVSGAILRESLAPVSADGWCLTFVLSEQQSHESGHMHRGCSPCQNSLGLLPLLRRKFWCPSPWARFCQHNAEHCPLPLLALCLLQQCNSAGDGPPDAPQCLGCSLSSGHLPSAHLRRLRSEAA